MCIETDIGDKTIYDFRIPTKLVGPIIGKKGSFVEYIKKKSNVKLYVEKANESPEDEFKICTLLGEYIFHIFRVTNKKVLIINFVKYFTIDI